MFNMPSLESLSTYSKVSTNKVESQVFLAMYHFSGVFLQHQRVDRQLLCQKACQRISVMKTNTGVFVVFKTKCELKCQN